MRGDGAGGAGLGTRLRPLTYEITKPMVPVLDRPVMEHIVDLLERHGFEQVIANLHYFPDSIREYFGERFSYRFEERAAGHRRRRARLRGVLRRGAVPGDLRRCAHGHRPDGVRGPPPARPAGSRRWPSSRCPTRASTASCCTTARAASRAFRRSRRPRRRSRTSATAASTCSTRRSSTTSRSAPFVDWAQDVFPVLLENDVPFHIHEVREYWNDVGSLGGAAPGHLRRAARRAAPGDRGRGAQPRRDRRRRHGAAARTPRSKGRRGSAATCRSARACA